MRKKSGALFQKKTVTSFFLNRIKIFFMYFVQSWIILIPLQKENEHCMI